MKYGITYMGSKDKIADNIIEILPSGKRLVDLFGGGFAITHAAMIHNRWKNYLYNEINPLLVDLVKRAVRGDFNYLRFTPEWVSREKFAELKDKNGYIKFIWSFGCRGESYMYSETIEPYKRACHYAIIFDDWEPMKDLCPEVWEDAYDAVHNVADKKKRRLKFGPAIVRKLKSLNDWNVVQDNPLYKSCHWRGGKSGHNDLQSLESLESLESLQSLERLESLQRLEIRCGSYLDYEYQEGDVVYCDPPYEGTAEYDDSFNHKEFYDWVASRPYPIYFSSYEISDDRFYIVQEWSKLNLLCNSQEKKKKSIERLYCNRPIKTMLFDFWA